MEGNHDSLFLRRNHELSNGRGEYGLVTSATVAADYDDDNDDVLVTTKTSKSSMEALELEQGVSSSSPSSTTMASWHRVLFTPLFPDDRFELLGTLLLDGVQGVRMAKFFVVTWIGLIVMYYSVRWMVSLYQ